MRRILDGVGETAAQVVSALGETLLQTPLSVALTGDESVHTGWARSLHYRWFTDPAARLLHPAEDRDAQSRLVVADLLGSYTRDGPGSRTATLVDLLLNASPEFAGLWRAHPVAGPYCGPVRLLHPRVGPLELHCQRLIDPDQAQQLVMYTAAPGTAGDERLRLLAVLGAAGLPGEPLHEGRRG